MKHKPLTPLLLLLAASTTFAQTSGGTGKGLDALDEQVVMSNLATNNLETLLDRDFHNFNVPPAEQEQTRTFLELRELNNYRGSIAGRRALAVSVAKGMTGLLPKATDPQVLFNQANQLVASGVAPTVAELEYFGENPVAQAQLEPVAETVKKMYQQVAALATAKNNALAAGINQANFKQKLPQLQAMKQLGQYGSFCDTMASYSLCIALPDKDPKRKTVADDAIKDLKDFDDPKNGIQATVRLQIGKLQMIEGKMVDGGFDLARQTLDGVADGKGITPAPTVGDQNNARYFGLVCLIESRKLNDAEKAIPDLENWEAINFMPTLKNSGEQDAVKAAVSMLEFRLDSAQSDLANNVAQKKQKNDDAIEVLSQLLKSQPNLKDLVFDQLIGRIPDQPDYASLNPLVLQALQQQGFAEVTKPEGAPVDEKKLRRAIDAAKELVTRVGQPGVDASTAGLSAYFIAYAYDRLKYGKAAAAAFMDFAEKYQDDAVKSNDAIKHAGKWVFALQKIDETDQDTRKLFDRFLPLAINPPFNMKELAFHYAAILQGESKFKEAVGYFQQVPNTDKRYANAQYLELLCLYKQLSEPNLAAEDKTRIANQIVDLDKAIDGMLASATIADERTTYVEWVVISDEVTADLTHQVLHDPARSLEILNGFEDRVAGAKDPGKAHLDALQLRISDYMDTNKTDEAVKAVEALMGANPVQGEDLVRAVLAQVRQDMEHASDPAVRRTLAQSKAALSGLIAASVAKSSDPKQKADLPIYLLDYAEARQQAAELSDDPAGKKQGLEEALKTFQDVYNNNKDKPLITDQAYLDTGLVQFDLGNYQQSMDVLGDLVTAKKLGEPMIETGPLHELVPNPQFWEGNFKFIRSVVELYKKNSTDPKARQNLKDAGSYLGRLFIMNGKHTGGNTYHDDFEKLKAEVAALQAGGAKPGK